MDDNSKCKHKSIQSLEDNTGENLGGFGFGNDLLDTTLKERCMKKKLISWATLTFSSAKDTAKSIKGQNTDWNKIFAKHIFERGMISKIDKEFLKLTNKKTIKF